MTAALVRGKTVARIEANVNQLRIEAKQTILLVSTNASLNNCFCFKDHKVLQVIIVPQISFATSFINFSPPTT
jgi:hypothetical protein